MNRITIGRVREKSKTQEKIQPERVSFREDIVAALGLCALCLMFLVPVSGEEAMADEAVAVMSGAVQEYRDGDEPAGADAEDESVFDRIGRMFASLLFDA